MRQENQSEKSVLHEKNMTLFTLILIDILAGAEFDLCVPSFPIIQNDFHLSAFCVEALLSVNLVGYCLSLFVAGSLADHYGRRPVILGGLVIFLCGTCLCLWPSYPSLLIGRLLQGIGIAAPAILSFVIIADFYPLKQQQRLAALLNGVTNVAVAIAPVLGSYIALYFGWQDNFSALLSSGAIISVMALCFIPSYQPPSHTSKENILSWRAYLPLFRSRPLSLLMVNIIFMFVPYWVFAGVAPLLYIEDLSVSLQYFGYYQGALALVFAMGSFIMSFMIHRMSSQKILWQSACFSVLSLGIIMMTTVIDPHQPLWITLAFMTFIMSQIIPSTILYPVCVNFMPEAKGRISAVLQGTRLIISAICLQLAGYFYRGSFQNMGVIISFSILIAVVTLFFVIHNKKIMQACQAY